MKKESLKLTIAVLLLAFFGVKAAEKPNTHMIIIDDLSDYPSILQNHPGRNTRTYCTIDI